MKTRVLIVDDAVVVRQILTDVLSGDPDIVVAGTAANGRIALQKITQVNPDLITLDVEMPEMDGLETLKALRKTHPKIPVIMFSTLTERGAEVTLDALAAGANDYVTKPANVGSVTVAKERIREQLIPKIKALCGEKLGFPVGATAGTIAANRTPFHLKPAASTMTPIDVVAIGTSTGGPNALAEIIPSLPRDMGVPIVIVQHMPAMFTKLLADRLSVQWGNPVHEAKDGDQLIPSHAYIAPGNYHMTLDRIGTKVYARLNQDPPENSCRPAVDVLFRSVAKTYGSKVLSIILTGMGQDGLRGCEVIRHSGGRVLAQDEASSIVWGMPGFVAKAGLAEKVLSLNSVAAEIARIVIESNRSRRSATSAA